MALVNEMVLVNVKSEKHLTPRKCTAIVEGKILQPPGSCLLHISLALIFLLASESLSEVMAGF